MHDIGKASERFQSKLRDPGVRQADDVRHEWLSMRVLQEMRGNGHDWYKAWEAVAARQDWVVRLGDRLVDALHPEAVSSELEAIDFLIVSHHGLLNAQGSSRLGSDPIPVAPTPADRHIRIDGWPPAQEQVRPSGEIAPDIFESYWRLQERLRKAACAVRDRDTVFWRALGTISRAALILADHAVSRRTESRPPWPAAVLYANTSEQRTGRALNQPLDWHLRTVGAVASDAIYRFANLAGLHRAHPSHDVPGLGQRALDAIMEAAEPEGRFAWQNRVADALASFRRRDTIAPSLVFNMAGTGTGKTRLNVRAACVVSRDEAPRVAIALNLRTLTLQTGAAIREAFGIDPTELAIVIGEQLVQKLFEGERSKADAKRNQVPLDDDENPPEATFSVSGADFELPPWLAETFDTPRQRAILAAPLLVSTIDFLIAAGNPGSQGHHVRAMLRLMSSDLILDEVDGYEPESLAAVLRLVQICALFGRNVICSSATLSRPVAVAVERSYRSGIAMRTALFDVQCAAGSSMGRYRVWLVDDRLDPVSIDACNADDDAAFEAHYASRLDQLATELAARPVYRLARLQRLPGDRGLDAWNQAVLTAARELHAANCWRLPDDSGDRSARVKRVSFGLVRVANIKTAIDTARFLCDAMPEARVACYHAAHLLIARFQMERRLDWLLSRSDGNARILTDTEIRQIAAASDGDDIPFIVVATPVEEIGRDHDFDWAVIDPSSAQSIVQTAGRVNRHRLELVEGRSNIRVLQFNWRHCRNDGDCGQSAFIWPGYEGRSLSNPTRPSGTYGSHDIAELLPWDASGHLVIDARLRFDIKTCRLARADDVALEKRLACFFGPRGAFCSAPVHAWTLTDGSAGPFAKSPLRSRQGRELLLRVEQDDSTFRVFRFDRVPRGGRVRDEWLETDVDFVRPQRNAWLEFHPARMSAICEEFDIDPADGLRARLTEYGADRLISPESDWTYDPAFGFRRRS